MFRSKWIQGDLKDPNFVTSLWKFDYVYHIAAYAAEGLSFYPA